MNFSIFCMVLGFIIFGVVACFVAIFGITFAISFGILYARVAKENISKFALQRKLRKQMKLYFKRLQYGKLDKVYKEYRNQFPRKVS